MINLLFAQKVNFIYIVFCGPYANDLCHTLLFYTYIVKRVQPTLMCVFT